MPKSDVPLFLECVDMHYVDELMVRLCALDKSCRKKDSVPSKMDLATNTCTDRSMLFGVKNDRAKHHKL